MKGVVLLGTCCLSGVVAVYSGYTVEVPAQNMLVTRDSSDVKDIKAVFPGSTRLLAWDGRLANADMLPYWRWDFVVVRNVEKFRYDVALSVMGSPNEGLKYRDKAHWHRPELNEWAGKMLHRFEVDTWDIWTAYRTPPTETEEKDFKEMLMSWFQTSTFANQGIHIEGVVVNLPSLSPE